MNRGYSSPTYNSDKEFIFRGSGIGYWEGLLDPEL
jgi:hypothetical protein